MLFYSSRVLSQAVAAPLGVWLKAEQCFDVAGALLETFKTFIGNRLNKYLSSCKKMFAQVHHVLNFTYNVMKIAYFACSAEYSCMSY